MEKGFKKLSKSLSFIVIGMLLLSVQILTGTSVSAQEAPVKIGILQYVENEVLNDVREGFVARMDESDYEIEWDVQNASGNQSNLQSLSETLARNNDILFGIATPAAQALAAIEQEKPIFIAAVYDPVVAGVVESNDAPGTNVTGTTNRGRVEDHVNLLVRNFPEAETVGLIYNSSEINSQLQVDRAIAELEAQGLNTEVVTITSTNDISQALTSIIDDVDAMLMVTDNTVDSAVGLVGDIAKEAGVPTIGSSDSVVETNGFATISNSYYDYGVQTADMVIRMLDEGLNPAEMPIEEGNNFELIVNEEFAEAIGINPASITIE